MRSGRSPVRRAVDWADLRRRVEEAGRALAAGPAPLSPGKARELLEQRAAALARPPAEPPREGGVEALTFTLGEEVYALESRYVLEVFRPADLARLPGAEAPVFGVTASRGELLLVLDLRPVLGAKLEPVVGPKLVVALGDERPAFGLVADGVRGIVRIEEGDIRPLPEGPGVAREYLRGMTGGAVLVLDASALLRRYGAAT
jgi:purine-binding chemotaxis protein CheW